MKPKKLIVWVLITDPKFDAGETLTTVLWSSLARLRVASLPQSTTNRQILLYHKIANYHSEFKVTLNYKLQVQLIQNWNVSINRLNKKMIHQEWVHSNDLITQICSEGTRMKYTQKMSGALVFLRRIKYSPKGVLVQPGINQRLKQKIEMEMKEIEKPEKDFLRNLLRGRRENQLIRILMQEVMIFTGIFWNRPMQRWFICKKEEINFK